MFQEYINLEDPVLYAMPLFALAILLEIGINIYRKLNLYDLKDSAACIAMGLGSLVVAFGVKLTAFIVYTFLYQFRFFELSYQDWWVWVFLFFADDFSFYWHHRLSHEVRILWAAHVNHHSSQNLNLSTALRQSWTELFHKYIFWAWMPIVGFSPWMILFMQSISLIFQFLQHTKVVGKLGPLEWVFNTPSHHRVHHASNIRYLDRNHAGILIIWDRLFGTFVEEDENEPCVYGITENIDSYNPLVIATHEYRNLWKDIKSAPRFSDKLKYMFYPPGWSHNGPDKTANYLRRELMAQH